MAYLILWEGCAYDEGAPWLKAAPLVFLIVLGQTYAVPLLLNDYGSNERVIYIQIYTHIYGYTNAKNTAEYKQSCTWI